MSSARALKASATQTKEKVNAEAAGALLDVKTPAKEDTSTKEDDTSSNEAKDKTFVLVCNPQFKMYTITTVGGAVTLGSIGGAFGLASGVAVGSVAGLVPALLTFGLSIPAGAVVGGSIGVCTGTLVGGFAGGVGGFTTYKYRVQVKDGFVTVQVKAKDASHRTKDRVFAVLSTTRKTVQTTVAKLHASVSDIATQVRKKSIAAVDMTKAKTSDALRFATTTKSGVTSSSAIAGAVVVGASSGAVGTLVGAAVGIVPAIFTFGLSIPAGAVMGLCVGTTVGAGTGAVGGGLAGYGGFTHRKAIAEGAQSSWSKVSTTATHVKAKTISCAVEVKESARSMVQGSTGSSEQPSSD